MTDFPLRVLFVTSEWRTAGHPEWASFLVSQAESLRALGVVVTVFPFRGGGNPLRYARAWLQLRREHRLRDYDLLHCQFGQSGLVALPAPVPVVVTYHGSDLQGYLGRSGRFTWQGKLLGWVSRWVSRFAAGNIIVADHLARRLPAAAHPVTIPCGIDLVQFAPVPQEEARARLGLPPGQLLVAFIANPANPIKRFSLAQAAVALLPPALDARLITVTGVPYDQVPLYMNACDVLLLTSAHEGSPTVVKEALACNLPVVSTDVGDVRERLAGVAGCEVCPDDAPETIAAALTRLLMRRGRVDGRAAVASLSLESTARQILDVYHAVLR